MPGATLGAAVSLDMTGPGLVYAGTDHHVWCVDLSNMSQHIPRSLGGTIVGGPAATWLPRGTLSRTGGGFFGRGPHNHL
jgi:hypothetical protein